VELGSATAGVSAGVGGQEAVDPDFFTAVVIREVSRANSANFVVKLSGVEAGTTNTGCRVPRSLAWRDFLQCYNGSFHLYAQTQYHVGIQSIACTK